MNKQRLLYIMTEYRSIGNIERRIESLRGTLERTTQQMNGMPHGSDGSDKMASMVSEIVDLLGKLDERRVRIEEGMQEIERAFDALPDQQRRIMRLRYIEGMSWKKIARETHYAESHLIKIQRAALERLNK